jgi:transposase-like protein
MTAAKVFFRGALEVTREAPERVTTDGHESYPRATLEELGETVLNRTNRSLNNWIARDHRGIEQRYEPMRGFGSFESAQRPCRAFAEMRSFYQILTSRDPPRRLNPPSSVCRPPPRAR